MGLQTVQDLRILFQRQPTRVDLSDTDFSNPDLLGALVTELKRNFTCLDINLNRCSLGRGLNHVLQALSSNPGSQVRNLALSDNDLGPTHQCYYLAQYLVAPNKLRQLNISSNRIGTDLTGLSNLFNSLITQPTGPLLFIDLSKNDIDNLNPQQVERLLTVRPNLFLNLHQNTATQQPGIKGALQMLNARYNTVSQMLKQPTQPATVLASPPPVSQNTPVRSTVPTAQPTPEARSAQTPAQSSAPITGKPCSNCQQPVVEFQYRCCQCTGYRLCVPCYTNHSRNPIHDADHNFFGMEVTAPTVRAPPPATTEQPPPATTEQPPAQDSGPVACPPSAGPEASPSTVTRRDSEQPLKSSPTPPKPQASPDTVQRRVMFSPEEPATVAAPVDAADESEDIIASPRSAARRQALQSTVERKPSVVESESIEELAHEDDELDDVPTHDTEGHGSCKSPPAEDQHEEEEEEEEDLAARSGHVDQRSESTVYSPARQEKVNDVAVSTPDRVHQKAATVMQRPAREDDIEGDQARTVQAKPKPWDSCIKSTAAKEVLERLRSMGLDDSDESDNDEQLGKGARSFSASKGRRASPLARRQSQTSDDFSRSSGNAASFTRSPRKKGRRRHSAGSEHKATSVRPKKLPPSASRIMEESFEEQGIMPDRDERVLAVPTAASAPRIPISYLSKVPTDIAQVVEERCKRASKPKAAPPKRDTFSSLVPKAKLESQRLGPGFYSKDITSIPFSQQTSTSRKRPQGYNTRGRPVWGV